MGARPMPSVVVCGQGVVWPGIGTTPRLVHGVVSCSRVGAPGGTRTHDLQVRNLTLYPLSYGRTFLGPMARFASPALGGLSSPRTSEGNWRRGRDSNPRSRLPHSTV